jgi:hypothetical protein
MTDNATNMLLAQRLMARLHPPETGGFPVQERPPQSELPEWSKTIAEQWQMEEQRRLAEQRSWEEWRRRMEDQYRWRQMLQDATSTPEPPAGSFASHWPSDSSGSPFPAWSTAGTEQQKQIDFLRSLERRPQWEVSPLPHYDIPAPDYRPLNQPITPPVPYLTPSVWPPSR